MRIFFTGATGVIAQQAIPALVDQGDEVTAVVRVGSDTGWLDHLGVPTVVVDLFDFEAVVSAVDGHDAVAHFATAIPAQSDFAKRGAWAANDRLRTDATKNLVEAALVRDIGVFVQESIAFVYANGGDRWLDESSPVDTVWEVLDSALDAERQTARVTDAGGRGVALRLARLYGPERVSGEYLDAVAQRKVPVVGNGDNFVSHLHVADAGRAVAAALSAPGGVYNVADSDPLTVADEMTLLAELLDVPQPRRIPFPLARAAMGKAARMLTVSHRVTAEAFRAATGWQPVFASARDGWSSVIDGRVRSA